MDLIIPKLPMRNKSITKDFYVSKLGFTDIGTSEFDSYLLLKKDNVEIHFFEYKDLDAMSNYGQVYIRVRNIEDLYNQFISNQVDIHPNGALEIKPWNQIEFSILDPDNNLITFGQIV